MLSGESMAIDEAVHAAKRGLADDFIERLAERVGGRASVQAVFGEPIPSGDLIVVPVARVRWGVGGGSGSTGRPEGGPGAGSASGGGGGATADPVGYLEIRPGGAVFQPIRGPFLGPLLVVAAGYAAALVLRALAGR